jgi:hypothetical protein
MGSGMSAKTISTNFHHEETCTGLDGPAGQFYPIEAGRAATDLGAMVPSKCECFVGKALRPLKRRKNERAATISFTQKTHTKCRLLSAVVLD